MSAWTCRSSDGKADQDCSTSSSNPMMERPWCRFLEEKHEPASNINTVVADSLKALDPEWPIKPTLDAPEPSARRALVGLRGPG